MSQEPWWSRSVWQVGPLAVGFLMLLAAALGWNPLQRNGPVQGSLAAIAEAVRNHEQRQNEMGQEMLRVLRTICRHVARSESAKEDCDR